MDYDWILEASGEESGWMARWHLWRDGNTTMEIDCLTVPFVRQSGAPEGDGLRHTDEG